MLVFSTFSSRDPGPLARCVIKQIRENQHAEESCSEMIKVITPLCSSRLNVSIAPATGTTGSDESGSRNPKADAFVRVGFGEEVWSVEKRAGDNPWNAWTLEWATTRRRRTRISLRTADRSRRPLWDYANPDRPDPVVPVAERSTRFNRRRTKPA